MIRRRQALLPAQAQSCLAQVESCLQEEKGRPHHLLICVVLHGSYDSLCNEYLRANPLLLIQASLVQGTVGAPNLTIPIDMP